jgi:hypothetical protein
MCGGGDDEGAGKGAGGDDFYTARIVASIKNTGRRRPTAAVRPRPRNRSIQQSTNILCDGYWSLKLEYTMIITIFMAYLV